MSRAGAAVAAGIILGALACGACLAGQARAAEAPAASRGAAPPDPRVVLVGIPGLRWGELSPSATPALWQLAAAGSVGNLVVHTLTTLTCPADGWLTLNGGARAGVPHPGAGPCPRLPAVVPARAPPSPGTPPAGTTAVVPAETPGGTPATPAAGLPGPARIPAMPGLVAWNRRLPYHYSPDWGLLASGAGPGRCALAIGPGAALALARRSGQVASYLPSLAAASRAAFSRCPLAVVGLGVLPPPAAGGAAAARAVDAAVSRLEAELPAGTALIVASIADGPGGPHLRPVIISAPGYARGLLSSAATRQPGLAFLTDLTPTVLRLRGRPLPGGLAGSPAYRCGRGSLAAAASALAGQDTAAQVYRGTDAWFFGCYAAAEAAVFGLITLSPGRSGGAPGRGRRRAWARAAGVVAGSVPAGTFLASLVPWWRWPHPAVWLYLLAAAWAAVVATGALAGPWRRDPLGPVGAVGAVTLAVAGLDFVSGSRLSVSTPFGLNLLGGNRVYGEANNTVGLYAAATVLCAAWLAGAWLARGARRAAVLSASAVIAFAVVAAGWPGFGAKVGSTLASVPGFALLLERVAGWRLTARRVALAAVSGTAVVAAFGLASYLLPVARSDVSVFVGQLLHGGGGGTIERKISTNLGTLTGAPFAFLVPLAVLALGVVLLRPAWFGAGALDEARRQVPLLGVSLAALWLTAVLGWLAEDSGVAVPGVMLPCVLPLVIAIVAGTPGCPAGPAPGPPPQAVKLPWSPGLAGEVE
jgi:hypothetical protein